MRKNLALLAVVFAALALCVGCRNKPPEIPAPPQGPENLPTDSAGAYLTHTTDPNRDQVLYVFDWDDGKFDTTDFQDSGDTIEQPHAWTDTGLYAVRVKAKDARGLFSREWSDSLLVRVGLGVNRPPAAPAMPSGPDTGWVGQYQVFSTSAVDPDGDSVRIRFIWGEDNRVSYWSLPAPSGTVVTDSVVYFTRGVKYVHAVAIDPDSAVSETSAAKVFYADQVNTAPSKPILSGPGRGIKDGPHYRFYAVSSDPQRDDIQYKFFWGDGNSSNWTALNPSDAVVMDSWRYSSEGSYSIRVLARDEYGAVSDTSDPKTFEVVGEGRVLWSVMFGDDVVSSPALADAVNRLGDNRKAVIIGVTNGALSAVDAWQGEVIYEVSETGAEPYLCSPAVGQNNTIYIGNGDGRVYAYTSAGSLKWAYPDTMSGNDMYASPLVDGNTVYVGGEGRHVIQLRDDGSSATELWSYPLREELIASPVLDPSGNLIVCDDSGYVYSFAPDHSLNWTPHATNNNITSSPAVGPDGTVYFGTEQGRVFAITSAGNRAWPPYEVSPPAIVNSSPVIGADGSIYFGADNGYLYRLDASGQPVPGWPVQLCLYDVPSTPILCADGYVYVPAANDTLYAVREDGTVAWSVWLRPPAMSAKPRARSLGVDDLLPSPVIDQYGIIYVAAGFDGLFAIAGRPTGTIANTPWPMFRHDPKHTGKYGSGR